MQRVFDAVWTLGLVAYVVIAVRVLRPNTASTVNSSTVNGNCVNSEP